MNMQHNDTDLIERFLEGSLNEKELQAFDERIGSDKDFADALQQRRLLQKAYVETAKRHEIKKHIHSVLADGKRKTAVHRKIWLVAASVILLAGVGSFLYFQTTPSANNNIAKQENKQQEDIVISGKENKIEEFGTSEKYNEGDKNSEFFLPADGAVFNQTDTILFSRENTNRNDILTITSKTGTVISKVAIQPGHAEYKVPPFTLKPGSYTWYLSRDSVMHSFRIK